MTIPVTGITPIFGFEYLVEGEPAYHIRQKWQRLAQAAEAALAAGPAAPPGAADLLTVSGRVSVLEAALAPAVVHPALTANFAPYGIAPFTEGNGLAVWKDAIGTVHVHGLIKPALALTTAATTICTLTAAYRPPMGVTVQRRLFSGGAPGIAPLAHTCRVNGTTGVVEVIASAAIAAGNTTMQLDFSYRTSAA